MIEDSRSLELDEEKDYLRSTIDFIDHEIPRIENGLPATAAYQATANRLQENAEEILGHLKAAKPNPYFGRIDFCRSDDSQTRTYYIGRFHVYDKVYSWTAPMATLFYNPATKGYEAPRGFISGQVELKRQLEIEDSKLNSFTDVLRLPRAERLGALQTSSDETLDRMLASTSEGELQEVVVTIQPEQYEQIAAIDKPVVIVQGAAGSGKSLVGLHRLAYLLSPHSRLSDPLRPRSSRVIMLGPSAAFLQYISNLLPSLGHRDIQQTTVRRWLLDSFSRRFRIDRNNRILGQLMNNRHQPSPAEYAAQSFKGSMQMATILDRHVKNTRGRIIAAATDIQVQLSGHRPLRIRSREVAAIIRGLSDLPLNNGRDRFVESILRELWDQVRGLRSRSVPRSMTEFDKNQRSIIEKQVDRFWPMTDFVSEYSKILANTTTLIELGRGSMELDKAKILAASSSPANGFVDTDLAPLLYLDHLLNDHPSQGYDHVVVDEAQDLSPLEIALLQRHSRNGWFTILGDVRQKLLPYRGISNWRQMSSLFPRDHLAKYESRTSYRSTYEITRICNRMLTKIPGSTAPPIPYRRRGERPTFQQYRTRRAMLDSIANTIEDFLKRGDETIGVLTKWRNEAQVVYDYLCEMKLPNVNLLNLEGTIQVGVTVSPILLTKGLEFDAVIVSGTHDKNFAGTEFDYRLLYLAFTRAKHRLSVQWFGRPSPCLPRPLDRGPERRAGDSLDDV